MQTQTSSSQSQSQNLTQEILGLEKKYWQAMQEYDLNTALSLTDFPCIVAGAHGMQTVDQKQYEAMFKANKESIKSFNFDESKFEVRQVAPDTVVTAYQMQSAYTKDGQTLQSHAVDTSTWIKKGSKWVCAMHTETEIAKK